VTKQGKLGMLRCIKVLSLPRIAQRVNTEFGYEERNVRHGWTIVASKEESRR